MNILEIKKALYPCSIWR